MDRFTNTVDNKLVCTSGEETLVIEPWGPDGLRVRATVLPEVLDKPWALTEPVSASAEIAISDTEATIRNGKISARIRDIYTQKNSVEFFRHNGERKDVELTNNPVGDVLPSFTAMDLRTGVTVWQSDSGMTHRLNVALTNITNALYAEFANASFFRPEPKRNLTLGWEVSF